MRALTLALSLLAAPALGDEFIVNAPTIAPFQTFAKAAGYWNAQSGTITPTGVLTSKTGCTYFFNYVGAVTYPDPTLTTTDTFGNIVPATDSAPGLWARLRNNCDDTALPGGSVAAAMTRAKAAGVIVYAWFATLNAGAGCWSSDGATCAASYVANIGAIE